MSASAKRSKLLSWYIGAAIILAGVMYLAEELIATPAPTLLEFGVLVVIPSVYLTLMYLTLKSRPDGRSRS